MDDYREIEDGDINVIIFYSVPNGWPKQSHIQGFDFELNTYGANIYMFTLIDTMENIYEGVIKHLKKMHIPTALVTARQIREEKPPFLLNLQRDILASAGKRKNTIM